MHTKRVGVVPSMPTQTLGVAVAVIHAKRRCQKSQIVADLTVLIIASICNLRLAANVNVVATYTSPS